MYERVMNTPVWDFSGTEAVYEPAEDSFLLLDALEADLPSIRAAHPAIVLEVGSGSGVIITAVATALGSSAHCVAVDISPHACMMTQDTARRNNAQVEVCQGDLACWVKAHSVDLLLFNPPYVVTADDEIAGDLPRAWAGGSKGRILIDRFLDQVDTLMSKIGILYLVVIEENAPDEIINILQGKGLIGKRVAFRKIRGEQLSVLRFSHQ